MLRILQEYLSLNILRKQMFNIELTGWDSFGPFVVKLVMALGNNAYLYEELVDVELDSEEGRSCLNSVVLHQLGK